MEVDPKPNLCQMFQEYTLTNGRYNNAALICIWVVIFMFLGPVYAILYAVPISIMFGMIASFDCFCCIVDLQGRLAMLLLPFRLVQAVVVLGLVVIFNALFWAVMLVPAYALTISWGCRMLYVWSCGRSLNRTPRVI